MEQEAFEWGRRAAPPEGKMSMVPVDDLCGCEAQPPSWLVKSVKLYGVVCPIIVQDKGDDGLDVVDGRRRLGAALANSLDMIPARVYDAADLEKYSKALAVALNEQRSDNDVTNFDSILALFEVGLTAKQIGEATGLTVPTIDAYISLCGANKKLVEGWRRGKMRYSVLRMAASLPPEVQMRVEERMAAGEKVTGRLVKEEIAKLDSSQRALVFDVEATEKWLKIAESYAKGALLSMPGGVSRRTVNALRTFDAAVKEDRCSIR